MISIADMVAIGTATAAKTYCKVILPCAEADTTGVNFRTPHSPTRGYPRKAATNRGIAICRRPDSVARAQSGAQGREVGQVAPRR
jgi:hypothetical protein